MSRARPWFGAAALAAVAFVLVVACSPSQVETLKARGPGVAARLACVVLRWTTPEGFSRELCATAEEIADFGEEMIAARAARPDAGAPAVVVAALEAPRTRRVPRRRCAAWIDLTGGSDGGTGNASATPHLDRAVEGSDGGRADRGDGGPTGR